MKPLTPEISFSIPEMDQSFNQPPLDASDAPKQILTDIINAQGDLIRKMKSSNTPKVIFFF